MDLSQFENQNINGLTNHCVLFLWGEEYNLYLTKCITETRFMYTCIYYSFSYIFCCLDVTAGAQTIIVAVVDESLNAVTWKYFCHCQYATDNRLVHDASACQRPWDYSLKMCDLNC